MRRIGLFLVLCLGLLSLPTTTQTEPENPTQYRSAPPGGTDYPWNMFHHDSLRTGATLASAPSSSNLMWSFATPGPVYSSPAVVNGIVYVGSWNSYVYAIDEYNGQQKWARYVGGPVFSSPAVANGLVYVGPKDPATNFLALDQQTGEIVWSYPLPNRAVSSSPVVADGMVFFGTYFLGLGSAAFYALDASTGTGRWIWSPASDNILSSPSVHNGRVLFGENNNYVVALNETTGATLWTVSTGGNVRVTTAPTVAYGRVFVGTENKFVALDEITGATVWTFNTQGNNATSGAVNSGVVYFGTGRGYVRALNATTGLEIWSYNVGSVVSSSPALALGSNTLVVGANDGYIYALSMTSGALLWRYLTGSAVSSSPAVADGRVFVGSQDRRLYALGPTTLAPLLQATVTPSKTFLKPGEISILTVTVTNGTDPQSGVTLILSSTFGGGFTTFVEQAPGTYQSNYTAPLVTQQTDTSITVRASKSGYVDDAVSTMITLMPFPPLTVAVTPRPSSVTPGSDILLLISVSNGTEPVVGASVFLSASGGGSFRDLTDGGTGNYTAVYSTGLQNSSPTLVVQASKPGFSTGEAQVTVTVAGVPDLTGLKIVGIPLFLVLAGLFLLAFVVFVAVIAKGKSEPDYSSAMMSATLSIRALPGKAYLRAFLEPFQWGWRP